MEVIKEKRGRRSRQARHAPRHGPYADRPHLRPRASSGSWRTSPSRDGSRRPHGRPDAPLAPRRARRRRHAYRWAAGHAGTRASGEANAQPYDTRSSKYLTCFELLFYLAQAKHQCEILAVSVWICQQAQLLSRAAAARFPPRSPLMPRAGIRPARRMRPKAQNMAAPQSSIQICAKSVMHTGIQGCVFAIVQVDGLSHPTLPGRLRILTTVSQIIRST